MTSNELKNGLTIEYEGNIYSVIEFMHVKPGKGAAFVRSKLRNLRTGNVLDYTFRAGEKIEQAQVDKNEMQYLYVDGDSHVFMNTNNYEQIEIPANQIQQELKFLVEGMMANVVFFGNEILGVSLQDKIVLEVTECDPAVKGDTKTNASKDAILQTGLKIQVPMFIERGEKIIVSTETGKYVSREK